MIRSLSLICAAICLTLFAHSASAQTYIDQAAVEELLAIRAPSLDEIPHVNYEKRVLYDGTGNPVLVRNQFYKDLGEGDSELGRRRARLIELLNRVDFEFLQVGEQIVVPDKYELDFRAYSPFPRYYAGARQLDKLFIIDKAVQAWAAYEYGQLARWGVVSTGGPESPTPTGRYNFNWKEPYRISELSPEDEPWEMYWVFNFHADRGIHIHQYEMPTDGPTSHGCVRLVDADARWIYDWAEPWTTSSGKVGYASNGSRVLKQGTMVLVQGEDPPGRASLFEQQGRYPYIVEVQLPEDPYSVPAGSNQQREFDRLRAAEARAAGNNLTTAQ
jgi:hypothetical protein